MRMIHTLWGVLLPATFAMPALSQTQYQLVDLGTIAGESHAFSVNDQHVALGSSTDALSNFRASVFGVDTNPLELNTPASARQAVAFCMDGAGRIIGTHYDLYEINTFAFRVSNGITESLGAFAPRACNSAGVIAGTTQITSTGPGAGMTVPRACRYTNGILETLGTLGGIASQGLGIDEAGRVVGSSTTTAERGSRACIWAAGSTTPTDLGGLATATTAWAEATAIRGSRIVGVSMNAAGRRRATLWTLNASGGVASVTDLGALPVTGASFAKAVNAAGVAVGTSDFRAVRFAGGQIIDLNTLVLGAPSDWKLEVAWSIADDGTIVGTGSKLGFPRAFMLVPCPPTGCVVCNSIDFNNNDVFPEDQDVIDFFNVLAGAECGTCDTIDFNNNGVFPEDQDVIDFFNVLAGGGCP